MKKILTIDGGGIRGVIPAAILANLEERLRNSSGNRELRLADCFDLLSGTSTGGILSILYLSPKRYSGAQILEFYRELGPKLFHKSFSYKLASGFGLFSSRYKEDALYDFAKRILGDATISEVAKDCLITSYEMTSRKALLFTKSDTRKYGSMADYKLCDIVRATSAAPTYFPPARVYPRSSELLKADGVSEDNIPFRNLVDGGIYANNPSMCALVEAIKLWPDESLKSLMMVSAGTGKAERSYPYERVRKFGYIGWLSPILDIMLSSVAETVDYQVRQVCKSIGCPKNYIRIEPSLLNADVDMDRATEKNIRELVNAAQHYIDHNGDILDSIVDSISSVD
ncbi:MAG: patatin-like phospholipase family protein [Bacteroidales bacterium]|nr:patatin-like phospholipase family protein [Bacteroidales bacterium]